MGDIYSMTRPSEGQLLGELAFLKGLPVEQMMARVSVYIVWLNTELSKEKIGQIGGANDKLQKANDLLAALYAVRSDEDHKGKLDDYFKAHPEKEKEINQLIQASGLDVFTSAADAREIKPEEARDWQIEKVIQSTDKETLAQAFEGKAFKDLKGKNDDERLMNLQGEVRNKLKDNLLRGEQGQGQWESIFHVDKANASPKNGVTVSEATFNGRKQKMYDFNGAANTVYNTLTDARKEFMRNNGLEGRYLPAKVTGRIHSNITVGSLEENIKKLEGHTQAQQSDIEMLMKELERLQADSGVGTGLSNACKEAFNDLKNILS